MSKALETGEQSHPDWTLDQVVFPRALVKNALVGTTQIQTVHVCKSALTPSPGFPWAKTLATWTHSPPLCPVSSFPNPPAFHFPQHGKKSYQIYTRCFSHSARQLQEASCPVTTKAP